MGVTDDVLRQRFEISPQAHVLVQIEHQTESTVIVPNPRLFVWSSKASLQLKFVTQADGS